MCNNLDPATLQRPFITNKVFDGCLTCTDLTQDNLQETPLDNANFSWLTDGSYLKGDNDKYCADTLLQLLLMLLRQRLYLWLLICAYTGLYFSQGQTANIFTNSR